MVAYIYILQTGVLWLSFSKIKYRVWTLVPRVARTTRLDQHAFVWGGFRLRD